MKLNPYLSPCTKLNSQWIKDLGIRPETLHLMEEKVGSNLQLVGLGADFLNRTPIAQEIKARINNWDRFKLKSFLSAKETISNVKTEPTEWEKIFATHTSDRALISRIYYFFICSSSDSFTISCVHSRITENNKDLRSSCASVSHLTVIRSCDVGDRLYYDSLLRGR